MTDLGQQMLSWYGGKSSDAPRRLVVNGLELSLVSVITDATVHDLFEQFAACCSKRAGLSVTGQSKKILDSIANEDWQNASRGIVRRESQDSGTIVCLDTSRPLTAGEVVERLRQYGKSRDLADLGTIRAATARRVQGKTQLLMLATVGSMRLDRAFPSSGDAPGTEPLGVTRPPESRRIFDATELGGKNALHVYDSRVPSTSVVLEYYRTELAAAGFRVTASRAPGALLAEQGKRSLMVVVSKTRKDNVQTSLVELSS